MAETPQNSVFAPSSLEKANSVEAISSEKEATPEERVATRPKPLVWTFVCISLYLASLLYGVECRLSLRSIS